MPESATSKFGRLSDLRNEASVEQFFVSRLLADLGYRDSQVMPKSSLAELTVNAGRRRLQYRPDYALKHGGRVRWICEAKSPDEDLDEWVGQCSSYCLELNRAADDNPVELFMLTNGVTTRVYRWDHQQPLLEIAFHQVVDGNQKYEQLKSLLAPSAFRPPVASPAPQQDRIVLRRRPVTDLNADFAWAHRLIYKRENLSYTAAFMEFVKVIFLKLLSDQEAHRSPDLQDVPGGISVLADDVRFSLRWIESRERDTPNPLDAIMFQTWLQKFETEIREGRKKRIFAANERLQLSSDTVRALVNRFQTLDLISMDADLNGRMFETFLNSTLRGKALGQYFTPRSVVKLATGLARLTATPDHVDTVIDACCGTGGFLIEALADMWAQIDANPSLTAQSREDLRSAAATRSLYGIDVARDPALARIARINMYLHGDGGSRIYQLDALDQRLRPQPSDEPEIAREKTELRTALHQAPQGLADVALTNPPFAKDYSRDLEAEGQLLDDYELAFSTQGGARRPLRTVSSMLLFLERYHGLLKDGGRLVTVVDDSILGSARHHRLRTWIRHHWIVKAVVSLPGDAFQRSQARVKTSIIVLEKRAASTRQDQPSVFMYYCTAVGVDDAPRQRVLPIDEVNRTEADREIREARDLYTKFCEGDASVSQWVVPASAINDRMDVKACLLSAGRRVADWEGSGLDVVTLADLAKPIDLTDPEESDRRFEDDDDELITNLRVRYDGFAEAGDEVWVTAQQARRLTKVKAGDIAISHINAVHGAVAVVPEELQGLVVTSEYTLCRPIGGFEAHTVWSLLRTPEARADLLLLATGIGRTRIHWEEARMLRLPKPTPDVAAHIEQGMRDASLAEKRADELKAQVQSVVSAELSLTSKRALDIIAAFRPPR